jgi:plasmid stabilization system protein ParE
VKTRQPLRHSERKPKNPCNGLLNFPNRALPEFPDLPFREVVIAPYRFFYRVKENTVWIVAVWHGAQLPKGPADDKGLS